MTPKQISALAALDALTGPDRDSRRYLGYLLGYPRCCIDDFIYRSDQLGMGNWIKLPEEFPLRGTGFVPCPVCRKKHTEEELRAIIEVQRVTPIPFPEFQVD